uniref:Translation initiation factor IF-2-like n=1 Tax=Geotrypetes seraphini TaxID=260995 RepID=A0A6P8QNT4_GEOSA|nr:translation initiation factor IF-2-like [Geotrypetes seraphini]
MRRGGGAGKEGTRKGAGPVSSLSFFPLRRLEPRRVAGMRAGCAKKTFRGSRAKKPFRGSRAARPRSRGGVTSHALRRVSGAGAGFTAPLPSTQTTEMTGRAREESSRKTRSIPPLLGPGGRGESGFSPSLLGPGGRGESGFSPSLLGPGGRGESGFSPSLLGPGPCGRGESTYPPSLLGPGGRGESAYPPSLLGPGGRGEATYPPSLLGPGGRGEMGFPRRANEGAQVSGATGPWSASWQGDGWGWDESRAAGGQQQQQALLPTPPGRGLVHLGERFPASEQELQYLYSLIQREAEKRGSPWVAGLCLAVKNISTAAEEQPGWPTVSLQQGEYEERPAPLPTVAPSEGVLEQIRIVWIAGHSAVACASRRACNSPYGQHLGLAANGVQVLWMDKQGVRSDELLPALLRQAEVQPCPDALVIHLGSNDFEQISGIRLIKCIKKDLVFMMTAYPNTKIIWSDILPNRRRRHEKCLDRSRKKINKQISDFVRSLGGIQIRHDFFLAESASLYRHDGIQLSDIGNDLFNMMLQGAIKSAFGIV